MTGERLAVAGWALGPGSAEVALDDNAVKGDLALPDARIAASAQGRLDGVIATRLTATDFEIGPILRQLRPDLFGDAAGRLSAVATLDVPARDPHAARGLVRLEPVRFEMAGERWEATAGAWPNNRKPTREVSGVRSAPSTVARPEPPA
jgi:hypothetical protein